MSNALFVAAGEEDQVIGREGEVGRAPGEWFGKFWRCGHGVVGFDSLACCALDERDMVSNTFRMDLEDLQAVSG